jgi:hypothetical protein
MRDLRKRLMFKTRARLLQEVGRHREIALGPAEIAMPQVRRQLREEALDIRTLAIPGHDPSDGCGMPEIMETGLGAHPIMADDAGTGPKLAEEAIDTAIA